MADRQLIDATVLVEFIGTRTSAWIYKPDLLWAIAQHATVDAVEVVRCKDCRAWDRGRISCEGLARCNSGEGGIRYRSGSDYCSKGVKVSNG